MAPLTTGVIQAILKEFSQQRAGRGRYGGGGSALAGITATGGVISDYSDGPAVYRAHVFTSTGTFTVSAATGTGLVEYLVVAGGGGGGARHGGGGGAGGLLSSHPDVPAPTRQTAFPVSTSPGAYTVTIGAGGAKGLGPSGNTDPATLRGSQGSTSSFGPVSTTGGGYGAGYLTSPADGGSGGSGGGGGQTNASTFGAAGPATNYPGPTQQGYPSGTSGPGSNSHATGGGGGAGEIGQNAVPGTTIAGRGGAGLTVYIAAPPTAPAPENSYAGGGGGGGDTAGAASPIGGGGAGGPIAPNAEGTPGTYATGGGGGGARTGSGSGHAGSGGSGIVVVRYQIGSLTATAKATGGLISFYSGKTIHTFTSSGNFNVTTGPLSVEYVVVGGGGGGASDTGGGGGAGAFRTATGFTVNPGPNTVTVGAGGDRSAAHPLSNRASVGGNTIFSTITSNGGGGGGGSGGPTQGPGGASPGNGSGGGGAGYNPAGPNTGGAGSTYGSAGGNGTGTSYTAGGGGGSGQAGTSAPPSGPGGYGSQAPPTFRNPVSAPTPTGGGLGDDGTYGFGTGPTPGGFWFAGGGGGSRGDTGTASTGGAGGGGSNRPTGNPEGLVNTGGGGGGGPGSGGAGSNGGSGIVIIAYPS